MVGISKWNNNSNLIVLTSLLPIFFTVSSINVDCRPEFLTVLDGKITLWREIYLSNSILSHPQSYCIVKKSHLLLHNEIKLTHNWTGHIIIQVQLVKSSLNMPIKSKLTTWLIKTSKFQVDMIVWVMVPYSTSAKQYLVMNKIRYLMQSIHRISHLILFNFHISVTFNISCKLSS